MNQRGLSSVISAVLLIAIAVVSISLLWALVSPRLNLSPEVSCTDLKLNSPLSVKDLCYDVATQKLEVIIERSLNSPEISSLEFSASENKNWICSPSCGACQILDSGSSKRYFFNIADISQTNSLTLSVNNCALTSTTLENIKNC